MNIVPVQSAEVQYEQHIRKLLTLPSGYTNKLPWVGSKGWLATLVDKALSKVFDQHLLCEVEPLENVLKMTFTRGPYKHKVYLTGFAVHLLSLGLMREMERGCLGENNAVIYGVGLGKVFIPKWSLHQLAHTAMPELLHYYEESNSPAIKQLDVLKNKLLEEHGDDGQVDKRVLH